MLEADRGGAGGGAGRSHPVMQRCSSTGGRAGRLEEEQQQQQQQQQTREMLASAAMVGRLGLRAVVAPAATWHAAKRGSKVRCHARWQVPGSICVWKIYGSTCRNETRATSTRRARLRTSGWHAPRAPVAMPAWCPCSTLLRARRRARPPRPPAGWCDCPVILVRPASVSAPTELATKSLQYRSSVSPADTSAARGRSRRNFWSLSSRLRGCLASR
jgi:hypothetical protein